MEIVGMEMARRRGKHLFWAIVRLVSTCHVSSCRPAWLTACTAQQPRCLPIWPPLLHASAPAF